MILYACRFYDKRLLLGRWQVYTQGGTGITPGPRLDIRQRYQHRALQGLHGQVDLWLGGGPIPRQRAGHGQVCQQVPEVMGFNTDRNVHWER